MMWKFDEFTNRIAAVDDKGTSISYGQLAKEGQMLADAIGERCLVFNLCRNDIGSLIGYSSCINYGIVSALLSANLDQDMLVRLVNTYHPRYIWTAEDAAIAGETVYSAYGYKLIRTEFDDCPVPADELALLLTTSGSTGSPKFVRQSARNIRANTDSIVEYLKLTSDERPITTLPMNYTYGLSIINTHLDVGATLLMTQAGIAQKQFWEFFREQQATSFGGVPYTYEMLDRMRFMRMELPSLRTMTQAGGKLLPELQNKFTRWSQKTGRQFIVMYGQCEATARMAYLPWERAIEKNGAMGIAIPNGRFELIDGDGSIIHETGAVGELRYYGDNVTLGYATCAQDLRKGDERSGILDTGDMATRDSDGYYTIVGRKKRFLKMYGNRINLDETERMLKAEFPGVDLACGGVDDHLVIYVAGKQEIPGIPEYLAKKTGLHRSGFEYFAVDAIPKNEAGKTLYRELGKLER